MDKKIIIGGAILLIVAIFVWVVIESTKPQPGQKLADLGRDHVPIGTKVDYNSNPPTSGAHYEEWTRAGVYQAPLDDGNLIHSLEHGYVVISYNCAFKVSSGHKTVIREVFAHGVEEPTVTESSTQATSSATLPNEFRSDQCHQLVDQLMAVYEGKGKRKLIVVPRPNLDSRIALTAWTRIDTFNDFDTARIERFIDAYRDHGPEKTME